MTEILQALLGKIISTVFITQFLNEFFLLRSILLINTCFVGAQTCEQYSNRERTRVKNNVLNKPSFCYGNNIKFLFNAVKITV